MLAVVGWCMVQETIKQTQARYTLAELVRREEAAKQRLDRLRAVEHELRSPARLSAFVREKRLKLVVLGSAKPVYVQSPTLSGLRQGEAMYAARRPGETMDERKAENNENGDAVDMASVRQW